MYGKEEMKSRPPIPEDIVTELMILCAHRCCLHHEEFNTHSPLDIHHLDGNPENNHKDNLLPVCKNCHHGRIHVKSSFSRNYTQDELKNIRDDWYSSIKFQKEEKAKLAVDSEKLHIESDISDKEQIKFKVYFEDPEILIGKKTRIIFEMENNTKHHLRFLSYQFQIYYECMGKLIHNFTFQKHIWNIEPNELIPYDNIEKKFNPVDPAKYYFLSDKKGNWIARVFLEFIIDNSVIINSIYTDATLKII